MNEELVKMSLDIFKKQWPDYKSKMKHKSKKSTAFDFFYGGVLFGLQMAKLAQKKEDVVKNGS